MPRSAGVRAVSRYGRSSMNDVVTRPARKSGSSTTACRNGMFVDTPADPELGQRAAGPGDRRREVAAPTGQLDQHRVEVGADLGTQVRAAVQPDTRTARRPVAGDAAGVGAEAVGRVLGGDPALHRSTVHAAANPGSAQGLPAISPSAMRSWLATRSTSVISSVTVCSTWMRGFISMNTWWPRSSSRNSTVPAQV